MKKKILLGPVWKKGILALFSTNVEKKQSRRLFVPQLLVAVILGVILTASSSQTSRAASLAPQLDTKDCANPGAQVDSYPISSNGTQIGEIDLYYNRDLSVPYPDGTSHTGFNCAWVWTVGLAHGKAQHITIEMDGCDSNEGTKCAADGIDTDNGDYHTYAGPVASTGSSGSCISVDAKITWQGKTYEGGSQGEAVHCGK